MENSSGKGIEAIIPNEIKGWNWGAFFLHWIWGIGNNTLIALLALIPCIAPIMMIILGVKGNEWAWRNKKWESIERFKKVQRTWGIVGASLFTFIITTALLMIFVILPAIMKQSTAYQVSLKTVQNSPAAQNLLGSSIDSGLWVLGNINVNGNSGNADISYSVKGDKNSGKVYVKAHKEMDEWKMDQIILKTDEGETLNLTGESP